jgi:hypothetical protein
LQGRLQWGHRASLASAAACAALPSLSFLLLLLLLPLLLWLLLLPVFGGIARQACLLLLLWLWKLTEYIARQLPRHAHAKVQLLLRPEHDILFGH